MYFFVHHDVVFHKRHFFPVGMQETLQQRRRFQRTAEIDALRSILEVVLNSYDALF